MYEDYCYKRESQKGIDGSIATLYSNNNLFPLFSYSFVIILAKILNTSNDTVFLIFVSRNVYYGIPGLFSALSVALHLF